ncbi:hypothetical protein GXP67_36355 [Rhodocytophaga rosea]|uniref:DinB family protein n=1 Tax=Rhodocytophaga rosea TaxID=2704465 RepID=A0A6C0GWR9_9BACT|nr:hypothetical protein [Rhodocytophaga rosea]QHT71750.1 hypothetical protein GXP67_36355 [Rhodocytophaga rosea]
MMNKSIFKDVFDTYKAFDNLTVANSGAFQDQFPTSVWQILNHLIAWQAYQIGCLQGAIPEKHLSEVDTWVSEIVPPSEAILQEGVEKFKKQLQDIERVVDLLSASDEDVTDKLKIIQELAMHLSFHLGEVVLMRRMQGSYPMPHQMKAFLQS